MAARAGSEHHVDGVVTALLDVGGLASVVYGCGLAWHPLWWIMGGLAALLLDWSLS